MNPKDQKNNKYFYVCENYLSKEIKSISESKNLYDLYLDLFDSLSCHKVDPSFGNKIQSDEGKKEGYETWIDQTYNESKCSFSVQNFDNSFQSEFLEYKETKFDYDSLIFYNDVSF